MLRSWASKLDSQNLKIKLADYLNESEKLLSPKIIWTSYLNSLSFYIRQLNAKSLLTIHIYGDLFG